MVCGSGYGVVGVRLVGGVEGGRGWGEGAHGHGDAVAGGRVSRWRGLLAGVEGAHLGVGSGRAIGRGARCSHGVEEVGRARVIVAGNGKIRVMSLVLLDVRIE